MEDARVRWSSWNFFFVHNYLSRTYQLNDSWEQPCEEFFLFSHRYGNPNGSPVLRVIKVSKLASLLDDIRDVFMAPRFDHPIKKRHKLVAGFITFLVQLLSRKTDVMILDLYKKPIKYLEKELGFLPTIHVCVLMVGDEGHEEVQNILAGIEQVADEAGSLIRSMLFSIDGAFGEMAGALFLVLDNIHILKANIMNFLNRLSSSTSSISPYMITPRASVMKVVVIVNSLSSDLENLMGLEDDLIADVKDQIRTLHQRLIFFAVFRIAIRKLEN